MHGQIALGRFQLEMNAGHHPLHGNHFIHACDFAAYRRCRGRIVHPLIGAAHAPTATAGPVAPGPGLGRPGR